MLCRGSAHDDPRKLPASKGQFALWSNGHILIDIEVSIHILNSASWPVRPNTFTTWPVSESLPTQTQRSKGARVWGKHPRPRRHTGKAWRREGWGGGRGRRAAWRRPPPGGQCCGRHAKTLIVFFSELCLAHDVQQERGQALGAWDLCA